MHRNKKGTYYEQTWAIRSTWAIFDFFLEIFKAVFYTLVGFAIALTVSKIFVLLLGAELVVLIGREVRAGLLPVFEQTAVEIFAGAAS